MLVNRWNTRIAASPSGTFNVELHKEFSSFTLDVIGLSAFGYEFDALEREDNDLYKAYSSLLTGLTFFRLLRFMFPVLRRLPVEANLKERRALKLVQKTVQDIVESRRKYREDAQSAEAGDGTGAGAGAGAAAAGGAKPPIAGLHTLLDIMLEPNDVEEDHLTDEEIAAQVLTFMVAGHETTSNALCWTWYLLMQHPEALARARDEARRELGDTPIAEMQYDQVKRMTYLLAVCRESLRLFPPAPLTLRTAGETRDVTTSQGDTYSIPKGTLIFLSPYVMHRDPERYVDPEAFQPERWMDGGSASTSSPPWLPFLNGPRSCIGSRFAEMELQMIMAALVSTFDVSLEPGATVKPKLAVTMRPSPGLPAVVAAAPTH